MQAFCIKNSTNRMIGDTTPSEQIQSKPFIFNKAANPTHRLNSVQSTTVYSKHDALISSPLFLMAITRKKKKKRLTEEK